MKHDILKQWTMEMCKREAEVDGMAGSSPAVCSAGFDIETVEAALKRTEATACAVKEPDCSDVLAAEVRKLRRENNDLREAMDKTLSCSNGHYNPLFKCDCYQIAHDLICPPNADSATPVRILKP